ALIRACSSVVSPGRSPLSRPARRTHVRSVSALQPIFPATDVIAAHWELCSPWGSRTIRTARSRTSGAYLVNLLLMAPSSQGLEPPGKAGRFTRARLHGGGRGRAHRNPQAHAVRLGAEGEEGRQAGRRFRAGGD